MKKLIDKLNDDKFHEKLSRAVLSAMPPSMIGCVIYLLANKGYGNHFSTALFALTMSVASIVIFITVMREKEA